MKGISTGNNQFNKVKFQKKLLKVEREIFYGDFGGGDIKPTPEQIARKKEREVRQAILDARKPKRGRMS